MDEVAISRACPTGCPGDTKGRSNDLLSDFRCEKEVDGTYISSADLHVKGMPEQHIYAVGIGRERVIADMLTAAADTIREYFFG
jgi:hypothetical protein